MARDIWLGAHTSAAGGSFNALYQGRSIGATTIQLFTSNQKQWHGRHIPPEEIQAWTQALQETGMGKVMIHDSYLINLGSPNPSLLAKSRTAFREEIERCHLLKIPYLNFHPGIATDGQEEKCLDTIVESLLELEGVLHRGETRLLLETTAGQGNSVGHRFEQLGAIIQRVSRQIPIGVTMDTCHLFVAGYDIRTVAGWEKTLQAFDQAIGIQFLMAFHLNDSVKGLGARVDRHAGLGLGEIGWESFRFVMTSPHTRHLPKYLETPDPSRWKEEIHQLRQWVD